MMNDQIADDVAYIRRRAEETGFELHLQVSQRGLTIAAVRDGRALGSSSYWTASPTDPLPESCLQRSVEMAIASARASL